MNSENNTSLLLSEKYLTTLNLTLKAECDFIIHKVNVAMSELEGNSTYLQAETSKIKMCFRRWLNLLTAEEFVNYSSGANKKTLDGNGWLVLAIENGFVSTSELQVKV